MITPQSARFPSKKEEKERQAAETLSRFRLDADGHLVRVDADQAVRAPAGEAAEGDAAGERTPSVRSDSTDIQAAMSAVRGRLQEHNERLPIPRHGANAREHLPGKQRKDSPQPQPDVEDEAAAPAQVKGILKKNEVSSIEAPAKRASFRFSSRIVGATDAGPETVEAADGHSKAAIAASCVQAMTSAALPAGKELGSFSTVDTNRVGYAFAAAHRYESGDASVVPLAGDTSPKTANSGRPTANRGR